MLNCTVIIPTCNRPYHLKRVLNYYNRYGDSLPLLIADSSSEENKKMNKATVLSFKNTLFLYIDKYEQSINGYQKFVDVLQQVKSKFCVFCADDDFVVCGGIRDAANFLEHNPSYSSAYGNNVWFSVNYGKHPIPDIVYEYYEGQTNAQEKTGDRLLYRAINNDASAFYAVHHTDFMKMIMAQSAEIMGDWKAEELYKQTPKMLFSELFVMWLPSVYGKVKCLDSLYYIRDDAPPLNARRVYITLADLVSEPDYNLHLREFLNRLVEHLVKQPDISLNRAQVVAKKAIMAYTRKVPSCVLLVNTIMRKANLPVWLDEFIRNVYRIGADLIFPHIGSGHMLPSRYKDELEKVWLCVLSNSNDIYSKER